MSSNGRSNDIAVSVRGLSKSYTIAHNSEKHTTLTEAMLHRFKNPAQRAETETFWALRDVDFDIKKGDVVGIIGRNGAGKSTLLKILSQITEPTMGEINLYGRVGSLLEVGTGFHPELTGRENVFLNGAILGMRKSEIQRQFDAIVEFAEVEKFLDTPVKRYSSGMYVRLAFAVAAHLNSEILIIDEVLAVGDANFQKKCMGKMEEAGSTGKTILFVSHSMPSVLRLCRKVLMLESGRARAFGDAHEVSKLYLSSGTGRSSERVWNSIESSPGDSVAHLKAVRILNENNEITETIEIHSPLTIEVDYWNLGSDHLKPTVSIHLINDEGITLFASNDYNNKSWYSTPRKSGVVRSSCQIPGNFLAEGQFFVLASVCTYNPNIVHAIEPDAVSFQVVDNSEGENVRGEYTASWPGVIRPFLDWEVSADSNQNNRSSTAHL